MDYPGTVLLVSHDRRFLDRTVTSTLVFGDDGQISEHVGGYTDWQRFLAASQNTTVKKSEACTQSGNRKPAAKSTRASSMTYSERLELERLPGEIEQGEAELAGLQAEISEDGFYQQAEQQVTDTLTRLAAAEQLLAERYERWQLLEEKSGT